MRKDIATRFQKGSHPNPETEYKKGVHSTPHTEFKKGLVPWHKGKKGVYSKETLEKMRLKKLNRRHPEEHKGENHYNWKGGVTPINQTIRNSIDARLWREAVFARDNFTCQKCLKRGGIIRAHHIKNFADSPELRFALDNGITFCNRHHILFHKTYGMQGNTIEQVVEYTTK